MYIHKNLYSVQDGDFQLVSPENWRPLELRENISNMDREIAFIKECSNLFSYKVIVNVGTSDRGYVPINLQSVCNKIYVLSLENDNDFNYNIFIHDIENKISKYDKIPNDTCIIRVEPKFNIIADNISIPIVLYDKPIELNEYTSYIFYNRYVSVHKNVIDEFKKYFNNYIYNNNLNFDNLIHLVFMVKNAGDTFERVLRENLPYIDRWTILDTGSTDGTIETIKSVLDPTKGNLYQEPFVNFKYSRNRLLDLAALDTHKCVFTIILDDTYILHGPIREFLHNVRSDDVADSFSITIKEIDMKYSSNRIIKTDRNLRYIYKIHEIIEPNYNVSIPSSIEYGDSIYIEDVSSTYMRNRTNNRKQQDLIWLQEEIDEEPANPRHLYYLAETYLCIQDWKNAYEWYCKRFQHPIEGYNEERYDAIYKAAVMADLYLNHPWSECEKLYLMAYEYDPNRAESMFQLGEHYKDTDRQRAYEYYKKSFEIGLPPINYNMNIKIDLYNYHLPNRLIPLCYEFNNIDLGEQAAIRWNNYNEDNYSTNWKTIFHSIRISIQNATPKQHEPNYVVFLMDGGWEDWSGETLRTRGLGGSETFIIRYAEELAKRHNVVVFCKCGDKEINYNGVKYIPIIDYLKCVTSMNIKICFINRYPVYIPVTVFHKIPCYLILHDLCSETDIIPITDYLKGILCLTEWHKQYVLNYFPVFKNKTRVLSYGLDVDAYTSNTKKYSFIFPSFPNRGLIYLLRMFPRITQRYPEAELNIFCRFDLNWVKNHTKHLEEIQQLINEQPNVINHGWVNGETLRKFWSTAHIWLYTCDFMETCCLTAFEAAASRTVAITTDLAALQESVGDRGIMVYGTPENEEWQQLAFDTVCKIFDEELDVEPLLNKNYEWVCTKRYPIVVNDFEEKYIN